MVTEVADIQLQLTTHLSPPNGRKAELACLVGRRIANGLPRPSAVQGNFAGERLTFTAATRNQRD